MVVGFFFFFMGLINNLQRYGEGAEKPQGTEKLSPLLEGAATRTQKKSSEKRAAPEKQWPPFRGHKWYKVILQKGSCTSLFFSLLLLPGWASPLAKCNWSASAAEDSRGWVWGTNGDNQDSALHTTLVEMERQKKTTRSGAFFTITATSKRFLGGSFSYY